VDLDKALEQSQRDKRLGLFPLLFSANFLADFVP